MVFSPGQNGKGGEKIKQNGKLKKNGFSNRKRPSRDKTRPALFTKETTIIPRHQTRKADEKPSHHHAVRSPQKRARIEAAEEVVLSQILSHVSEPLSSASLVTEELMPLELRSAKNNNNKRTNYGKNSPTFILKDD